MLADAIVVGGGIVGAACGYELAAAGLRVTICEASFVGSGATAAGMGHLAVMDDSEAQFALTSLSQRLWAELADQFPASTEYQTSGSLWIAADDEELAEVYRKRDYYTARGIPVEVLGERQVAEAEPYLRKGMAGALLMTADGVCYPPSAARYLCDCVVRNGGAVRSGCLVTNAGEGVVHLADGSVLRAGAVIVATGTAVTQMFPQLAVAPRKGHLLITDRYPGFIRHQLIELGYLKSAHSVGSDSVAFNAQPRATGQVLIGSSRQYGITDSAVEERMMRNMIARAILYLPELADLSAIRTWTGFRAATPDKLPLIGRAPGYRKLYLATGHEGLGISTSLATGRLLADEILGRTSEIPREPYSPARSFAHHA